MLNHKFWIIFAASSLFITGCTNTIPDTPKNPVQIIEDTNTTNIYVPQRTHRKIKLKEVQDSNFSSEYMYPEDKVKKGNVVKVVKTKTAQTVISTENTMAREECIGMIGQEKFDKYTQMFGDEASSIKRCAMLKSMR